MSCLHFINSLLFTPDCVEECACSCTFVLSPLHLSHRLNCLRHNLPAYGIFTRMPFHSSREHNKKLGGSNWFTRANHLFLLLNFFSSSSSFPLVSVSPLATVCNYSLQVQTSYSSGVISTKCWNYFHLNLACDKFSWNSFKCSDLISLDSSLMSQI